MPYTKSNKEIQEENMPAAPKYGMDRTPAMYTPYKMKGSPMYRNFGVGSKEMQGGVAAKGVTQPSPNKQAAAAAGGVAGAVEPSGATPEEVSEKLKNHPKFGGMQGAVSKGGTAMEAAQAAQAGGAQAAGGGGVPQHGPESHTNPRMEKAMGAMQKLGAGAPKPGGHPKFGGMPKPTAFGGVGGMWSDIRLKEKIQRTGSSPSGIPIYEFNYIGSEARYSGAMAQDLLEMNIDAVSTGEDGWYLVDYNNIDVDMHQIN